VISAGQDGRPRAEIKLGHRSEVRLRRQRETDGEVAVQQTGVIQEVANSYTAMLSAYTGEGAVLKESGNTEDGAKNKGRERKS